MVDADVAELADAPDSGSGDVKVMQVQLLSSALLLEYRQKKSPDPYESRLFFHAFLFL